MAVERSLIEFQFRSDTSGADAATAALNRVAGATTNVAAAGASASASTASTLESLDKTVAALDRYKSLGLPFSEVNQATERAALQFERLWKSVDNAPTLQATQDRIAALRVEIDQMSTAIKNIEPIGPRIEDAGGVTAAQNQLDALKELTKLDYQLTVELDKASVLEAVEDAKTFVQGLSKEQIETDITAQFNREQELLARGAIDAAGAIGAQTSALGKYAVATDVATQAMQEFNALGPGIAAGEIGAPEDRAIRAGFENALRVAISSRAQIEQQLTPVAQQLAQVEAQMTALAGKPVRIDLQTNSPEAVAGMARVREIADALDTPIPVNVQTGEATANILRLQDLAATVAGGDRTLIVNAETDAAIAEVNAFVQQASLIQDRAVTYGVDIDLAASNLQELQAEFAKLQDQRNEITMEVDVEKAEEDIRRIAVVTQELQRRIERLRLNVEIDPEARGELDYLQKAVDQLGSKKLNLELDSDIAFGKLTRLDERARQVRLLLAERFKVDIDAEPALGILDRVKAKFAEILGGQTTGISAGGGISDLIGGRLAQAASGAGGAVGQFAGAAVRAALAVGPLGIAVAAAGVAFLVMGPQALQAAAQMETFSVQLEVLLGSAEKAGARLAELTEFAKVTPFSLTEVVEGSRILEVFAGKVLATGEGLRLVGDVAAGTGSSINQIADNFGRLYTAMKSGEQLGEQLYGLQRIGALSGEGRARIQALADAVKSGAATISEAWPRAAEEFARFSGLMEKQAATLAGKLSNLGDATNQMFARIGQELLPYAKGFADIAIAGIDVLSESFGALFSLLRPQLNVMAAVFTATADTVVGALEGISTALRLVSEFASGTFELIGNLGARIQEAFGNADDGGLGELVAQLGQLGNTFTELKAKSEAVTGQAFGQFVDQIADAFKSAEQLAAEAAAAQVDAATSAAAEREEAFQLRVQNIAQALPEALRLSLGEVKTQAYAQIEAVIGTYDDARAAADADFKKTIDLQEKYGREGARVAEIAANLQSDSFLNALASKDAEIRGRAEQTVLGYTAELKKLTGFEIDLSGIGGKEGGITLANLLGLTPGAAEVFKEEQAKTAAEAAQAATDAYIDTLAESEDIVNTAWGTITDIIKRNADPAAEAGHLFGILQSREVAAGLADGNPLIRAQMEEQVRLVSSRLDLLLDAAQPAGAGTAVGFNTGLASGEGDINVTAERLASIFPEAVNGQVPVVAQLGSEVSGAYASGIRNQRSAIDAAIDTLNESWKNRLSRAEEIANLIGVLTSKRLAQGLRSGDAQVKADAEYLRDLVREQLGRLGIDEDDLGGKVAELLGKAARSGNEAVSDEFEKTDKFLTDLVTNGATARSEAETTASTAAVTAAETQSAGQIAAVTAAVDAATTAQADFTQAGLMSGLAYATGLGGPASRVAASMASLGVVAAAVNSMAATQALFQVYGFNAGASYGMGIAQGLRAALPVVRASLGTYRRFFEAKSPPGPDSPLHEIDIWGERTFAAFGDGMFRAADHVADRAVSSLKVVATRVRGSDIGDAIPLNGVGGRLGRERGEGGGLISDRAIELLARNNQLLATHGRLLGRMARKDPQATGELAARGIVSVIAHTQRAGER